MIRMIEVPTAPTHLVQPHHFPATLQEAKQDQFFYPNMLTYLMNQIVILLKKSQFT